MKYYQKQAIQNLWQKYYVPQKPSISLEAIKKNYPKNISQYYPRFHLVTSFSFYTLNKTCFF